MRRPLAVMHSFSLSRVSHRGEFYLERFLMRQHCTQLIYLNYVSLLVPFFVGFGHLNLDFIFVIWIETMDE